MRIGSWREKAVLHDNAIVENVSDGVYFQFWFMQEQPISAEISGNKIADNAECGIFAPGVVILTGSDNELFNNRRGDLCGHIPADTTLIPPRERRTLRVPEEYETIQAAIDAAGLGDTVTVAPGTYQERIGIIKPLTLRAAEVEVKPGEGPKVTLVKHIGISDTRDVTIEGLIITGDRGQGYYWVGSLEAYNSINITLKGNSIYGDGVKFFSIADVTLEGNFIRSEGSMLNTYGRVVVKDNVLIGFVAALGIGAGEGPPPPVGMPWSPPPPFEITIADNLILGGLLLYGHPAPLSGEIRGNTIRDGRTGIDIAQAKSLTIVDNTITKNGVGVEIGRIFSVDIIELRGNVIAENGVGVSIAGTSMSSASTVNIVGNTIAGNGRDGISFNCQIYGFWPTTLIKDNLILNNGGAGVRTDVYISPRQGVVTLTGNLIRGNGEDVIRLWGEVEARIENNTVIKNNGFGVALYLKACGFKRGDKTFAGVVEGKRNVIPGPDKSDGNKNGAVCPKELEFLMTEEGGRYP